MKKLLLVVVAALFFGNLQAQVYSLPIDSIQFVRQDSLRNGYTISSHKGDSVKVKGVVRFNPRYHALATGGLWKASFIEDTVAGEWKGLNIRLASVADSTTTHFFDNMLPGNYVEVTGVVDDFSSNPRTGETQVNIDPTQSVKVLGFATPLPARVTTVDQFMKLDSLGVLKIQHPTGEKYEGMYVQFNNVTITDVSTFSGGTRIDWSIQDAQGNKIKIRDMSSFFRGANISSTASSPQNPNAPVFVQQGKVYSYVRGIIVETITSGVNYYQLAPIDTSDLGPLLASPPFVAYANANPVVPTSSQSTVISSNITDIDGTVASATLYYSVGATVGSFTSVPMTASGSVWSASIPAQTNGSKVNFYVKAVDNAGNVTNFPDSLATNSYYIVRDAGVNAISYIQGNTLANGNSIFANKYINSNMSIRAVVTSTTANNDLGLVALQDASAPYSGIMAGRGQIDNALRGDSILITAARVLETNGVTSLDSPTFTIISRGNKLPAPLSLNVDSVIAKNNAYLEQYESMFMGVTNVYAVSNNPDSPSNFGEFLVAPNSSATAGLRVDDVSNDIPANFNTDSVTLGQNFAFANGIFTYSFGNWKLMPRNRSDLAGFRTPNAAKNIIKDEKLVVYPNPNNGTFMVQVDGLGLGQLSVLDLNGKVLYSKSVSGNMVHEFSAELPSGLYLVRWSNNGKVSTQKMMVK